MRANLDKDPRDVAQMFDAVAERYDITNDVLSLGQDRRWRQQVVQATNARPGEVILDLASGTGTSAEPLAASGAVVIPCDFSQGMITVGKDLRPWLPFVAGDALRLPFANDTFDGVTISFGLRNVNATSDALEELARVTKPGGRMVVCEFSQPTWRPFRTIYTNYLMRGLPEVARRMSSNPEAYVYLAESIRSWPSQRELAQQIAAAGWDQVAWRNLSGGIVALHRARKPNGGQG
jgi:demethylmenaquinone methyltransferase/2-methoxy-6-polyprenyl-1,4-benzoquinol methylase